MSELQETVERQLRATDVAILHERQAFQKQELEVMKGEFREFKATLTDLTSSINSIKWVSVGVASMYLIEELGLATVLKTIIAL